MRWAIIILAVGLSATACRSFRGSEEKEAKEAKKEEKKVTPVMVYTGRIALVKPALKYVVVEGEVGEVPPAGAKLGVYRGENKVAELQVSAQSRSSNYAADILSGAPQVGDSVRSE